MSESAIPYPIGTGSQPGDPSGAVAGILFDSDHDANAEVLSKLMADMYYDGNNALDTGASGAALCVVFLRTSEAAVDDLASRKGATVGQECQVEYTTGGQDYVFDVLVQENAGYPFISFASANCVSRTAAQATAAIADYSAAAFIDALDIYTAERFRRVYASRLITQYNASEALTGANIATDAAASDLLATEYNVTKTDVELAVTTGTGEIKAGQVSSTSLDKASSLSDDSPLNLLKDGTTRDFLEGQDIALGLKKYGLATSWAEETTIIPYAGKSSQKSVAAGSNAGVEAILAGDAYATELASENVTVIAKVYSSVINNVKIGIEDDVTGLVTDTPALAAATWTEISATVAVTAGTTELTAVILSAGAGTIYVTDIQVNRGDSVFKHYPSPEAVAIHHALDNKIYNYIPFGDCAAEIGANDYPGHAWFNGASSWTFPFGATCAVTQDKTNFHSANASMDCVIDVGEYLQTYIGLTVSLNQSVQELLGKSITASCYLLKDGANTEDIDLQIITNGTGGTTTSKSFAVNDYSSWAQIAVTLDSVPSDATSIRLRIINNGSGQINCNLDSFMLTQTEYPIAFTTLTGWQYIKFDFTYAGSQPDPATVMDCQGGMAQAIPVGINCILCAMTVYQGTPGTGNDLYFAYTEAWSGAAWVVTDQSGAFSVTLGNGEDYKSAADDDGICTFIPAGSLIGAKIDGAGINAGSDAFVTLHCLTWGI